MHDELRTRLARNASEVLATLTNFDEMSNAYGRLFQEAYLSRAPLGP
jgi:hypothetical protein